MYLFVFTMLNNFVNRGNSFITTTVSSSLGVGVSVDPVVHLRTVGQHAGNYLLAILRKINTCRSEKYV